MLAAAEEDPLDPRTWSGSSAYFFSALKAQGCLAGSISASTSPVVSTWYKLRNFRPNKARWKFRYHLDTGHYAQMSRAARRQLETIDPASYDVIVQIGALFDLAEQPGKLTVSYHDGNLATRLQSPYGFPAISQAHIQTALVYENQLYGKLDHIFTMSQWLANSFVTDCGVDHKKLTPIGAGINLPRIKKREDLSYEAPRMLFVGKDFARKGGRVLLEAFREVRRQMPDASLTIIGPDVADLPPGVKCLSYVSKATPVGLDLLLDEYVKASLFVMPSLYEPFGVVFAEAMAHKLPCVGTKICAMPEIIEDGKTGFVVPPQDARALADRMLTLLQAPALCRSFGEAGYRKYLERFTWARVAENMVQRVRSLL